jgi:cytochrome oxidase Cu insertion factor (SCO1/SenC/PrrC family)
MNDADANPAARKKLLRSRLTMLALFFIALAPIAGSYLLYYSVRDEGPWATTNAGQLMAPGLTATGLRVAEPAPAPELPRRWWLVLVSAGGCTDACAQASDRLRALQILLKENADRLRRGLVVVDPAPGVEGWTVLHAADPGLERLDGAFPGMTTGIYLIDPLGNVVLRYDFEQAGKPVLDDVKKLMKVSQIG